MNIVLLGHEDAASLFALSLLVALRPEHEYRAFLSEPPAVAAISPTFVELTAADRALCGVLAATGRVAPPLREAARLLAPNSPAGLAALTDAKPDLVVSIRYRRILREVAIAIPRLGVLNLHSGILPDYQGVMATFWALLAGDAELGCTLHRIVDPGIDTGPVIGIARRAAAPARSYLQQVLDLYPAGVDMMARAIDTLAGGGEPVARPQLPGRGRYCSTPDAAALDRFLAAGFRLVDGGEAAWLENQSRMLNYLRNY